MTEYVTYQLNLKKLSKVTFIIVYSIFAFAFLVMGQGLFDEWNQSWTWTTIIYLIGVALFIGIQEKLPKDLEAPVNESILGFCISFPLATVIFIILHDSGVYFTGVTSLPVDMIPAMFLYQLVIVVCSEEIIFRGVIYRFLRQFNWMFGVVFSSIIFAIFHYVAYQGNISAMFTAFLIGCILALAVERWNLGVAIGIHFAWNIFILGITALVEIL